MNFDRRPCVGGRPVLFPPWRRHRPLAIGTCWHFEPERVFAPQIRPSRGLAIDLGLWRPGRPDFKAGGLGAFCEIPPRRVGAVPPLDHGVGRDPLHRRCFARQIGTKLVARSDLLQRVLLTVLSVCEANANRAIINPVGHRDVTVHQLGADTRTYMKCNAISWHADVDGAVALDDVVVRQPDFAKV